MKKILMGLVALSTLSFAAQPSIGGGAANDTTVFEPSNSQTGKIVVNGSLTTTIKPNKYVVYATTTGSDNWDDATDVVTLPPFVLSQLSAENNFDTTTTQIPTVYVRKVNADGNNIEALVNETVVFNVEQDPLYTSLPAYQTIPEGNNYSFITSSLLSHSTLSDIISNPKLSGRTCSINDFGYIVVDGGHFRTPNAVRFTHSEKGKLEVDIVPDAFYSNSETMGPADAQIIQSIISGGKSITNVSLKVTIS